MGINKFGVLLCGLLLAQIGCGQQGPPGPQGPEGISTYDAQPIQFCGNATPSYPTTFPEVGLCIQGQLYAVYSANDGFLALIPPGNYESNAIGSACNFTVGPGCAIADY